MDWASTDQSTAFLKFKEYCELVFKGPLAKKSAPEKATYLLLWLGQEGIDIFNTWELDENQKNDPQVVMAKYEKHFEPKSNFRLNRFNLQKFKQLPNESVDEFMTRCKIQAKRCKFTATECAERLIEQLVIGTKIKKVQEILLAKDETLTLDKAMDIARTKEATIQHMEELTSTNVNIDASWYHHNKKGSSRSSASNTAKCGKCGLQHDRSKCPAHGSTCRTCGKQNHWQKVCRSGKQPSNTFKPNHTRNSRSRSKSRNRNQNKRVNAVNQNDDESHVEDMLDLDQLRFESIHINHVSKVTKRDEAYADVGIKLEGIANPATLKVKVDTGAQGNVLPIRIFRRMYPKKLDSAGYPKQDNTQRQNTVLTAYNGSKIPHHGTLKIPCTYKEYSEVTEFFLADVEGPAILGLPSCLKFKLVSLNCSIKAVNTHLITTIDTKEDLQGLYPDRFDGIGKFEGEYHIVINPDIPPVVHAARRCPIQIKDEIKKELDDMETLGVIKPVTEPTDWVSSLAYSQKSNGRWRVCLDPKDLNTAIKRSHHHTPTLEEITYKFAGKKVFSKLDARHGYWSVSLDNESSMLTTFNSPFGRYRFIRLPFGLCVSQDIFQQKMDQILEKCPGTVGIADDVGVYGKTEAEHDENLHNLMRVARAHGLVFNLEKCDIKKPEIKFFGLIYSANGVRPDQEKVKSVEAITAPTNAKELQQFLGIATYMAPFIPNLSTLTSPLRELMKQDRQYEWLMAHQKAFDNIKKVICEEVTLAYFDPSKDTVIQVDASQKGLGAALMQDSKPICFASKSLTDTEQRYANIERELLAVVYACEKFHTYVYGKSFTVQSDHKPLEMIHIKNLGAAPPRLQRFLLRLQGYDVKIKYKPGKEMLLADAMSRLKPIPGEPIELEEVHIRHVQFSDTKITKLQEATNADPELSALSEIVYQGWPDNQQMIPKLLRKYWSYRDELSIENGLIMKGQRIIIPKDQRPEILEKLHEAHQGIVKCQLRAKGCVFWHNINHDIEEMTKSCSVCQSHGKSQPPEPMKSHEIPSRPWQTVATDIFFLCENEYLLIADYYSKYTILRQIPKGHSNSSTVIRLLKNVFAEQGIPESLISDNGPHFNSQIFRDFSKSWNFTHTTSSPRYPQSNGFIERNIQTVKTTIKKAKQSNTDVQKALMILRATPIDHHLPSPAELLYGRKLRTTLPAKIENTTVDRHQIHQRFQMRQEIQKQHFNKNAHPLPPLHTGQTVHIQDKSNKKWIPGTIQDVQPEPRSYKVETETGQILRRNRRHLKETNQKRVTFETDVTDDSDSIKQAPTCPSPVTTQPYQTRYGRTVVKPTRLDL